jgi:hypothetical protein
VRLNAWIMASTKATNAAPYAIPGRSPSANQPMTTPSTTVPSVIAVRMTTSSIVIRPVWAGPADGRAYICSIESELAGAPWSYGFRGACAYGSPPDCGPRPPATPAAPAVLNPAYSVPRVKPRREKTGLLLLMLTPPAPRAATFRQG